ncbi:hypothetical protein [Piscinibacter sp.]|jgi:hypothetical protein|uniref:hypothetical protein n=1 Tax=Piscinibacter sp. TaxID=1903157 RepID=UPI002F3F4C2A
MNMSSTTLLIALGATLLGAGVAFALAWTFYTTRLIEANSRVERALKGRHEARDLLRQARRQIEILRKELELARRLRAAPSHPTPVPVDDLRDDTPTIVLRGPASGYADTLPFVA